MERYSISRWKKMPKISLTGSFPFSIQIMQEKKKLFGIWMLARQGYQRETGVNPVRTRRCDRGRIPHDATVPFQNGMGRRGT
jgi:hypothetical protein